MGRWWWGWQANPHPTRVNICSRLCLPRFFGGSSTTVHVTTGTSQGWLWRRGTMRGTWGAFWRRVAIYGARV